jgi:predicted Holliday junction resolvase-like endonuclease
MLELIGIGIIMLVVIIYIWWRGNQWMNKYEQMQSAYNTLLSQKKSSEVRLGQITEHLAPFLKDFPFNPKKAHFIGNPIDLIVFEDDKIVIVEVKSGGSKLSDSQKKIKSLVEEKKIEWYEHRVE